MNIVATTERLELRKFSLQDAPGFFEMNNDLEVIRYTGDRAFHDLAETEAFILNYDQYDKYGYGRWALYEKVTRAYVGFCGLKYSDEKKETDIGFRLIRKYWNLGLGTEAARAALKIGFLDCKLEKIVGRAMQGNLASIRVLEKMGMQKKYDFTEENENWVQYELLATDYFSVENLSAPE